MKEVAVTIRSKLNLPLRFREAVAACELEIHRSTSLSTLHGSHHWHIRKPGSRGTLEATWLPAEGRFFFSVRDNRNGVWIDAALSQLSRLLQTE